MAEFSNGSQPDFQPVDVSEPREIRRESEILEEQAAFRRSEWFRSHMTVIFAVVGVVLVALIVVGILFYSQKANPLSRVLQAASKDFGTKFNYTITLSADDAPAMHYEGSIDSDRGSHQLSAVYQADYGTYTYTGAVTSVKNKAYKGSLYKEKWTIEECTAQTHDFFDFEADFARGEFDGGALLRFLGLTSEFSADELNRFESWFRQRLSTESDIATITSSAVEGGTETTFELQLSELFREIAEEGAPLFYHSSDYDSFKLRYEANKPELERSKCTMRGVVNASGYLSEFSLNVKTVKESYTLDCVMSDFGKAKVELPEAFTDAVSALETD